MLKKLIFELKFWKINKHNGIEIKPENETDLIIFINSLTIKLSVLIKTCEAIKNSKDKLMTDMIFESSSLKVELLKFVELKNSTGRNNTNNERKNTIKNQNRASPDQAVRELSSLVTVIRR